MEVRCDKCQARYRVDDARIGPQGLSMRCGKCQNVFRVMPPGAAAAEPPQKPVPPAPRCASSSEEHSAPRETTATGCRGREATSVTGRAGTAHIRGGGGPDHDVSDGEPAFAAGRREEGAGSFQASRRRDHGVWRVAREVGASASARPRSKTCRQGGRRSAIDDDVRCAATQDPGSACRGGADAGAGCARGTACVA
ncbi:MAG: hypothetical protein E6J82_17630 [Deltaproteobacteria bacterium]|nr:MAG: hypothetical protein E6J82_17630 [Deltaproteobacteria bacterium]